MAEACGQGADLFVMPEYASAQWLSFAPPDLSPDREVPWMADQAPKALDAVRPLAAKHGMALLAGTMPWRLDEASADAPAEVNRAWLILPDGTIHAQDKLCLTPGEKDPLAWQLTVGHTLTLVRWRGLTVAIAICLDVELPALSAKLAPHAPDLLLVPSMTEKRAGFHRVNSCARARAVELQAAVLTCGCIGDAATGKPREGNTGGAAVYLPSEPELGHVGIAAETGLMAESDDAGPLLIHRLPFAKMAGLRAGGAEVWPGAWNAAAVNIAWAGDKPDNQA
ncbi:nitrilase-related carbon-nitrogen hydrolase [Rhodovibrio salinarum]|nr:nitrilase-related carbon-nitrogen hydrolase [Rhodovibrio salinarum]